MPSPSESFIAQASRLVEAARANERAVRDLDETAQILMTAVEDLAEIEGLADALGGLADQAALVRDAVGEVAVVGAAAEELAQTRLAMEGAAQSLRSVLERVDAVASRAEDLDRRLAELDGRLSEALDRVQAAGLDGALARIDSLDAKLDRLLELFSHHGEAFFERVEPQVARLEDVAQRMDAPAMADELADVLATNHQLFEAIDAIRAENSDAQAFWDALIEDWHRRQGRA